MKVDVKKSCGHVEEEQLFGPGSERDRKLAWMEKTGLCRACYAVEQTAARETQNAAAATASTAAGLPTLTGTERQVPWATTIRQEWIGRSLERVPAEHPSREAVGQALIAAASSQPSAGWWIDHRDTLNRDLAAEYKSQMTILQQSGHPTQGE